MVTEKEKEKWGETEDGNDPDTTPTQQKRKKEKR